jgi:hypothetical protein
VIVSATKCPVVFVTWKEIAFLTRKENSFETHPFCKTESPIAGQMMMIINNNNNNNNNNNQNI